MKLLFLFVVQAPTASGEDGLYSAGGGSEWLGLRKYSTGADGAWCILREKFLAGGGGA